MTAEELKCVFPYCFDMIIKCSSCFEKISEKEFASSIRTIGYRTIRKTKYAVNSCLIG